MYMYDIFNIMFHLSRMTSNSNIWHFNISNDSDDIIAPFWPIRDSISTQECVLLFQDRIVIPSSLRPRVLEQRARAIVYWPGEHWEGCFFNGLNISKSNGISYRPLIK